MDLISCLEDKRINATNLAFEISIGNYLEIASSILDSNIFQRRRVKSSSTIYALLKDDLKLGCVIPPLVLAFEEEIDAGDFVKEAKAKPEFLVNFMKKNIKHLLILDGLQRTYTLLELRDELMKQFDEELLKKILNSNIRIELYISVNRIGILYRMLTLNTGQTPMSLRHQIEILYSDYLNAEVAGLRLISEVEEQRATHLTDYKFRDVMDGFNSYLERNELPIDKFELLENIKGLEKLAKENQNQDIFRGFLLSFHVFLMKMVSIGDNWKLNPEVAKSFGGNPFGVDVESIFKKNQTLSAFGAAVGRLKDFDVIDNFESLNPIIANIKFQTNPDEGYNKLLKVLDDIRLKSKKIGNAQRMYFQYFFRELFNSNTDSYGVIEAAVDNAYQKYLSQI
ncbi:MAG: hypothetical protein PHO67_01155 [Candidatus Omnitrophica bacterium]|nr:hypothetical protein [Candidatus Omnitrophota bacterium]